MHNNPTGGHSFDPSVGPNLGGLTEAFNQLRKRAMTILILRGVLGVLLGIFLLLAPAIAGASLATLASVFIAIWLIAEGIGTATLAWQERKVEDSKWGWPFVGGIAGVIAGVAIFVFPLSFAWAGSLLVLWFVAISVIISGIGLIRNRNFISGGLWLGIINIAFGILLAILLVANPTSTMISMVWVMGIFGVAYGIQAIIMGFKVRPKKTA